MNQFIDLLLRVATIGSNVVIIGLVVLLLTGNKQVIRYVGKRALVFSFCMALLATLGSLFYSEIMQFEPCKLCWIQRIFMYPQAVLLGVGLYKKEKKILDYTVFLSLLGFLFALYHYGLNWYAKFFPTETCPFGGGGVSCTKAYFTFGYVNIPLMSLAAFSLLLLFYFFYRSYESSSRGKKNT